MTAPAGTRSVRRTVLIVVAVVAALLLSLLIKLAFSGSDDTAPAGGATQPPAATTASEAASTAPATASTAKKVPVPSGGDARGCPDGHGGIDRKDPYCKKRKADEAYTHAFADNPAYKCADGRNDGLDSDDLAKFRPCINSSLRLEIQAGGSVTLYSTTSQQVGVERGVAEGSPEDSEPGMYNSGRDWLIRQTVSREPSQIWHLKYFHNPDLNYYATYLRKGRGDWRLLDSPDEEPLDMGGSYQVAVFWDDPRKPESDAPLPSFFKWSEVAKPGQ